MGLQDKPREMLDRAMLSKSMFICVCYSHMWRETESQALTQSLFLT